MMLNSKFIEHRIIENLENILSKYDLEFIILYGSVAEDRQHSESDIDIAVSVSSFKDGNNNKSNNKSNNKNDNLSLKLSLLLDEILGTDNVNVSIWETLPPHLKFEIISTGKNIYVKNIENHQAEIEYTLKIYWDHKIWKNNLISQILENSS